MKRVILVLSAIAVQCSLAFGQDPLPNAGFETWNDFSGGLGSSYREPEGWSTANQCSQLIGTYSVTRTATAHSGMYAAELKTRNAFIGSVKVNGVMTTANIICSTNAGGQEGGVATTSVPDSIAFWYKYAPVDVDTAYVQVILFNGEDTVSFMKGKMFVAKSEWTRASFAIPTPTGPVTMISTFFNSSWGDGAQGQGFVNSLLNVDDVEYIYATGIGEQAGKATIEVYPNPVKDILNVSNSAGGNTVIEIVDATGRMVLTRPLAGNRAALDLGHLPSGLYMYQLRNAGNQVLRTGKFLKGN